jgi:hypothetical protein
MMNIGGKLHLSFRKIRALSGIIGRIGIPAHNRGRYADAPLKWRWIGSSMKKKG